MALHSEKRLQVHINKRAACQSKQSHIALPATRNSAPNSCHSPARSQNLVLFWQTLDLSVVNKFCHIQRPIYVLQEER